MKPICFMIMPYGKKATQAEVGQGVATIDFNALWDRAYAPVIKELGYDPVRADQDVGGHCHVGDFYLSTARSGHRPQTGK